MCCIGVTEVVTMLMEDSHLGLIILYKHYFFIYFISEFPYKIHIILSLQSAYKKKKKKKKESQNGNKYCY